METGEPGEAFRLEDARGQREAAGVKVAGGEGEAAEVEEAGLCPT